MITTCCVSISENLTLELPLVKTSNFAYYSFNLMGMTKWNRIIGDEIYKRIIKHKFGQQINAIITVESKSIGLVQVVSELLNVEKYTIIRKSKKSYMIEPVEIKSSTIISGECSYWVDLADLSLLRNKNILIIDDVISSGGTLKAIMKALDFVGMRPILLACALTEGTKWSIYEGIDVISCGHLPIIESGDYYD